VDNRVDEAVGNFWRPDLCTNLGEIPDFIPSSFPQAFDRFSEGLSSKPRNLQTYDYY
jgi:hypothetical protein